MRWKKEITQEGYYWAEKKCGGRKTRLIYTFFLNDNFSAIYALELGVAKEEKISNYRKFKGPLIIPGLKDSLWEQWKIFLWRLKTRQITNRST